MVRQWVVGASRVGMFVKQLLFKNYELAIWGLKTEKGMIFQTDRRAKYEKYTSGVEID